MPKITLKSKSSNRKIFTSACIWMFSSNNPSIHVWKIQDVVAFKMILTTNGPLASTQNNNTATSKTHIFSHKMCITHNNCAASRLENRLGTLPLNAKGYGIDFTPHQVPCSSVVLVELENEFDYTHVQSVR